ncbi:MAG TPA: hypothetical protein VL199_20035 [Burkholderiales bacterium]|nr:hypothetical protein [Burkholderiales bacterium]
MAGSTLDPDNIPAKRGRHTQKGHDVASLGPSNTSDSGSDMQGPGLVDDDALHLDRGTNEDPEGGTLGKIEAGQAVGDRDMDDTSDSQGTGEHLTAGKDPRIRPNEDRDADRVVDEGEAGLGRGLDEAELARKKPERKR